MSDGSLTDEQVHIWLQDIADKGWVSLHFDSPALGGPDNAEIAGGGYQRFKMIWSQPSSRAIWSQVDAKFTGLVQNKITYFGVWDAAKKGMLRAYGELPDPVVVLNGKGYTLHHHLLVVSFG
jgi:hypothetical protein